MGLVVVLLACWLLQVTEQKAWFLVTVPSVAHVGLDVTLTLQVSESPANVTATVYFERQTWYAVEVISPQKYTAELSQRNNFTQIVLAQILPGKTLHLDFLHTEQFASVVAEISAPFHVTRKTTIRLRSTPFFIYIVTDKPIYTPNEIVRYQIFTLDQEMTPKNCTIAVELLDSKRTVLSTVRENKPRSIHTGEINIGSELNDIYQIRARVSENSDYYGVKTFQVQQYEFPRFYLQIIPDHWCFMVNSNTFSFTIQVANNVHYTLNANVRFGISMVSGQNVALPQLDQHLQVRNGRERVVLQSAGLLHSLMQAGNLDKFIGSTFYIEAEVSDGERSERKVLDNLPFRLSHYLISFASMKLFFTPGARFYVPISVTYPDGSPAINVSVRVGISLEDQIVEDSIEGLTDELGEMSLSFTVPRKTLHFNITASAGNESSGIERRHAVVKRHWSDTGRYLHISVPHVLLYPGDVVTVKLTAPGLLESDGVRNYYYMVLGNSRTLDVGRVGRPDTWFEVLVTRSMVPTFRLVAYYVLGSGEIIADSVRLEVESLCDTQFQVKPTLHQDRDTPFHLTVMSHSSAQIFVQATDTRLQALSDDNFITPRRVFEDLSSADIGLSSGSGQNTAGVFKDSGLSLLSDLMTPFQESVVSQSKWARESSWGSDGGPAVMNLIQKDVGPRRGDVNPVEPTFNDSSIWMLDTAPGTKTFRLDYVIRHPKFWEIQALSVSEEDGLCLARRAVIQTDGAESAEPEHHHEGSTYGQWDTTGERPSSWLTGGPTSNARGEYPSFSPPPPPTPLPTPGEGQLIEQ